MEEIHKNHRSRLRRQYLSAGLSSFAPHNVLELLLFFPIPRRDTNPAAHALLAAFGTPERALSAAPEELCRVKGIADRTAAFFGAVRAAVELAFLKEPSAVPLRDSDSAAFLFADLFRNAGKDAVGILLLNNRMEPLGCKILFAGSAHSPRFHPEDVLKEVLLASAPICILAHTHAGRDAFPAEEDFDLTRDVARILSAAGVRLAEHFLIGNDRYCTLLYRYTGEGEQTGSCGAPGKTVCFFGSAEERKRLSDLLALSGHGTYDPEPLFLRYGSLRRIFSARANELRHAGVPEPVAVLLSLCGDLPRYFAGMRPVPPLSKKEETGAYLCTLFRYEREETVLLLLYDKNGKSIGSRRFDGGTVNAASVIPRKIAEAALFSKAASAVLAHNHPDGDPVPSPEDETATETVAAALFGVGVRLVCHYVVADNRYTIL